VPNYPSISLGAYEASVFDMVGAYSAFVNQGTWIEPTAILRIEDKNGTPIYDKAPKVVKALNSESAYIIVDMLKKVVSQGTARRIQWKYNLTNPIGGKTGTTNDNSDAWFIGITPELVTGVWTGAEDRGISFDRMEYGQGAAAAMPVFAFFMQKVYKDSNLKYTKGDFEQPQGGLTRVIDCNQYWGGGGSDVEDGSTDSSSKDEPKLKDDRLGF
jgi:penicillin-binding protein 1A